MLIKSSHFEGMIDAHQSRRRVGGNLAGDRLGTPPPLPWHKSQPSGQIAPTLLPAAARRSRRCPLAPV